MRLERTALDRTYTNLRHMIFVCDCGRLSDQIIAEEN
jgi:hypothetical protein